MPNRGTPNSEWITLENKFPCSLNKDSAPEALSDGESPDAYGMGIDKAGYLYADSSPSTGATWNGIGTTTAPADAPATCVWRFFNNRLWGYVTAGGTTLYYGAYGYDTDYLIQDLGFIPCDYENTNITNVIPFGDQAAVFKGDNLYVVMNSDSPSGSLVSKYVKQASGLPVAANVIAIDDTLVWANTHGMFSYDGRSITELTRPIRDNLAPFVSTSIDEIKADFQKRRVIGLNSSATKFIIELGDKPQLYDYSTSGFKYTSKTLVADDASPLLVDKVGLIYQYDATDRASVTLGIKINDDWKKEDAFPIRPSVDSSGNGFVEIPLRNFLACRKWALRITALSSSFYVNAIKIHLKQGGVRGYANK